MIIKRLREENGWSQEQLANVSGLGLRTIQRVEAGARPSLETMKSLCSVFEIDMLTLEKELLVIDKTSKAWKNNPLWIRVLFVGSNKTWRGARREAVFIERLGLVMSCLVLGIAFFQNSQMSAYHTVVLSCLAFLVTYLICVFIRASDQYMLLHSKR